MKTKFTVFEKGLTKHSNIVNDDLEISSCDDYKYLVLHLDKKLNFVTHIEIIVSKLAQHCDTLYKLRETLNKGQLVHYLRSYVSPILHYCVLLYRLGAKTKLQKILITQKKQFELPYDFPLGHRSRKVHWTENWNCIWISDLRTIQVFAGANQMVSRIFTIGIQQRQTRNVSFDIWTFSGKHDVLDSWAIILINALRKWGVLPSDEMICEMDEKQFEKRYHQTSDL